MASEASGRSGKPPRVVEAVQVSRGWKGGYQADYPCPKCKSPLASKDDTLLGTDTCPNCKAEFVFGSDVGWRKTSGSMSSGPKLKSGRWTRSEPRELARSAEA